MVERISDLFWEAESNGIYVGISPCPKKQKKDPLKDGYKVISTEDRGMMIFHTVDPLLKFQLSPRISWDFLQRIYNVWCVERHNEDDRFDFIQFVYPGTIPFAQARTASSLRYDVTQTHEGLVTLVALPDYTTCRKVLMKFTNLNFVICNEIIEFLDYFPRCLACCKIVGYECKHCHNGAHHWDSLCQLCETTCSLCGYVQGANGIMELDNQMMMQCVGCQSRCHERCASSRKFISDIDRNLYVCLHCSDHFIWCDGCTNICQATGSFHCDRCGNVFCKKTEQYCGDCESCYLETNCVACSECEHPCDEREKDYWVCSECMNDWHYECLLPYHQDCHEAICHACWSKRKILHATRKQMVVDAGFTWHKELCHDFKWGNQTLTDVQQKFRILAFLENQGLTWTLTSEQLWHFGHSDVDIAEGMKMNDLLCNEMKSAGLDPEDTPPRLDPKINLPLLSRFEIDLIVQDKCEQKMLNEYVNWDLILLPLSAKQHGPMESDKSIALKYLESIGQRYTKPWLANISVKQWRNQWQPSKDPKRRKTEV